MFGFHPLVPHVICSGGLCVFRPGGCCPKVFSVLQGTGRSQTCAPGPVLCLPCQWSRPLRGAQELHCHPAHWQPKVCLGIAASVSLGLKQHVLFLDSTGGFTASRLYQMLQAQTEDEEEQLEALQRIQVVRVFSIYELLSALQELRDRLSQQVLSSTGPLKMVLLDSVSAVIYPLLGGRQSEGLALMMQLSRELKTLAREFSLAVVVTNQVTRDSSTGPLKPALGRSWSFVPSTRVLLESKEGSTQRAASLAKSPRQPTGIQVELDIGNGDVLEPSLVPPTQGL
ncbi:PREDICTED: DNA repair protein RAD51 homolog 4 isoform X2 [Sturnus vulgaris]|uniref:DNA repair protein RAD51 homolog 4 isoform X2 n=1 Tax=Sturnus vulgaris TaxID=9172 RepID=UPI00071A9B47|nr:PREDICTED: DNA repair protein RAD51 homolog 4 isoform X2 [Sturnus vulgaris]